MKNAIKPSNVAENIANAKAKLLEMFKDNKEVFTLVANRGRQARRHIVFLRANGNRVEEYTFAVARCLQMTRHGIDGGIITQSDGYDLVSSLSLALYGDHQVLKNNSLN